MTEQLDLFAEWFACDRCDVEAAAENPGEIPKGWTVVARGILCTRTGKRKCEPFELHYCESCSSKP